VSQDDVELLRRAYAAFARRDLPAMLDVLDPGIEWVDPPGLAAGSGVHRGHEAVLADVLDRLPRDPADFVVEPEEFLDAGENVVVLGHYDVRNARGGDALAVPFAHVWTMRAGFAVRFRSYPDTARLLELLG
jgi:uncharacterized protein